MHFLPPLVASRERWVLPLADASAIVLADILLSDATSEAALLHRLEHQLRIDPPLLWWTVCTAAGVLRDRPAAEQWHTIAAAAQWLAAHAVEVLQWPSAYAESTQKTHPTQPVGSDEISPSCALAAGALADAVARAREVAQTALVSRDAMPAIEADPLLPRLAAGLSRLRQLEQRFEETLERAKLDAMAEFAAGAGHEINNPLAVISGRAQLMLRDEKDAERRRGLALINAQVMRVYEMIADLRLFARPPALHRQRVNCVELVDRVLRELAPRAVEQQSKLCRLGETGPLEIEADGDQLAVALTAIGNNSLDALGQQGHVEFHIRSRRCGVEIEVADDGPGLTPEVRRHLFDPFYSAREAGRGLGLGLAKCWQIVARHDGHITVESQPNQGMRITVILPGAGCKG